MELKRVKIEQLGKSVRETFCTDNPKIKEVTFEYAGKEDDLDKFLKILIVDFARKKKYID